MCEPVLKKQWKRRAFLKGSSLAAFSFSLGGIPAFLPEVARNIQAKQPFIRRKTLVCIFQRGAMDGIMAVQPIDDPFLAKLRPDLTHSAAKSAGDNQLLVLNDQFGLHPSLSALYPLFQEKRLAIVHGVGSPEVNRSHFDAQDFMESGTPGIKGTTTGWLNRAIGLMGHEATPFRAVSITPAMPRSLYGKNGALAVEDLSDLSLKSDQSGKAVNTFSHLYEQSEDILLKKASRTSLEALRLLEEKNIQQYKPAPRVEYPNSTLGHSLRQIAQLIKAGLGLEVAFAESNGWDTHSRQGGKFGTFNVQALNLGKAIAAFWEDLGTFQDDVVVMTMTEFGRTVHQNGSFGTDHGRGSCQFILGNAIAGGEIYGEVPVLAPENLEDGRDLPVTTDFRSVFMGTVQGHLGISQQKVVFPGWDGEALEVFK